MGENIVERVAMIIDPNAFKAWQSSYDYNLAQGETDEGARGYADWSQKAACDEALAKAREILAALREPSDAMWDRLARAIMMWLDMEPKTPRVLFRHLELTGHPIPDWLRDEPEMKRLDHVPSKGTRCVIIWRAMLEESLTEGTEHDQG